MNARNKRPKPGDDLKRVEPQSQTSLAEALYDPAIAGPEFDEAFAKAQRRRRDPVAMKMRDVDL